MNHARMMHLEKSYFRCIAGTRLKSLAGNEGGIELYELLHALPSCGVKDNACNKLGNPRNVQLNFGQRLYKYRLVAAVAEREDGHVLRNALAVRHERKKSCRAEMIVTKDNKPGQFVLTLEFALDGFHDEFRRGNTFNDTCAFEKPLLHTEILHLATDMLEVRRNIEAACAN